jgi:hypothetical protein
MRASFRRIAGLLSYAVAAFMAFMFVAAVHRRVTHGWGYSVTEDVIAVSAMAVLCLAFTAAGHFLKPGKFSLATLLVGVTAAVVAMALATTLTRQH